MLTIFPPILTTSSWHFYLIGLLSKVDIWRATYLPPLVNIVFVRPLTWTVLDMMILELLKTLTGHKFLIWLEKAQLCFIFHFMILSYIFFISEWQVYFDLYLRKVWLWNTHATTLLWVEWLWYSKIQYISIPATSIHHKYSHWYGVSLTFTSKFITA